MYFGDDKARQMARSILPSTWKGAARRRAGLHRAERRGANVVMHLLARDPDCWEDETQSLHTCAPLISQMVDRRRGADKLNHFEHWAVERTRDLPLEQRLDSLRSVMPPGVIGEHALGHLKWRVEFSVEPRRSWVSRAPKRLDRGDLAQLLRRIVVTPGAHRLLHLAMRASLAAAEQHASRLPTVDGFRPLQGLHDVLPFLELIYRTGTSRAAVEQFCKLFREHRFDARAAARAFPPLQPWRAVLLGG